MHSPALHERSREAKNVEKRTMLWLPPFPRSVWLERKQASSFGDGFQELRQVLEMRQTPGVPGSPVAGGIARE